MPTTVCCADESFCLRQHVQLCFSLHLHPPKVVLLSWYETIPELVDRTILMLWHLSLRGIMPRHSTSLCSADHLKYNSPPYCNHATHGFCEVLRVHANKSWNMIAIHQGSFKTHFNKEILESVVNQVKSKSFQHLPMVSSCLVPARGPWKKNLVDQHSCKSAFQQCV